MSLVPTNATDGNLSTRWRHNVNPTWLKIGLNGIKQVAYIDIAWYYPNASRVYHFNIHYSINDIDYDVAIDDRDSMNTGSYSSTSGKSYERYVFENPVDARYIKINVKGNSEDNNASIWEVVVGTYDVNLKAGQGGLTDTTPADVKLSVTYMSASSDDGSHPASKANDNDYSTYWRTTSGNPSWLKADLGQNKSVGYVQLSFYRGATPYDDRIHTFNVDYSTDNSSWTPILGDQQNDKTDGSPETFTFPTHVTARYVRINIKGNDVNNHAGMYELDVFGSG